MSVITAHDVYQCCLDNWTQHKKAFLWTTDIEDWCDARGIFHGKRPDGTGGTEIRDASIDAQNQGWIVRWKEGPHRTARVYFSLSSTANAAAYAMASGHAQSRPPWIDKSV